VKIVQDIIAVGYILNSKHFIIRAQREANLLF